MTTQGAVASGVSNTPLSRSKQAKQCPAQLSRAGCTWPPPPPPAPMGSPHTPPAQPCRTEPLPHCPEIPVQHSMAWHRERQAERGGRPGQPHCLLIDFQLSIPPFHKLSLSSPGYTPCTPPGLPHILKSMKQVITLLRSDPCHICSLPEQDQPQPRLRSQQDASMPHHISPLGAAHQGASTGQRQCHLPMAWKLRKNSWVAWAGWHLFQFCIPAHLPLPTAAPLRCRGAKYKFAQDAIFPVSL